MVSISKFGWGVDYPAFFAHAQTILFFVVFIVFRILFFYFKQIFNIYFFIIENVIFGAKQWFCIDNEDKYFCLVLFKKRLNCAPVLFAFTKINLLVVVKLVVCLYSNSKILLAKPKKIIVAYLFGVITIAN